MKAKIINIRFEMAEEANVISPTWERMGKQQSLEANVGSTTLLGIGIEE